MSIFKILDVTPTQYILFGGIILVLVALLLTLYFIFSNKKRKKTNATEELGEEILLALGGAENVIKAKIRRSRLEVEVHDVELLQPRIMREHKLGAIVTKQVVTLLVKNNSKEIHEYIERKRKEVLKWKKHS